MNKKIIYILQKEDWNALTGESHKVNILSTMDRELAVESAKKLFKKEFQSTDIPDNESELAFECEKLSDCDTLKEDRAYRGYYSDDNVMFCYDVVQMVMNQFYNENPNP